MSEPNEQASPWLREADDLIRAAAGGFLFSIPLLYTMEVWWVGSFISHQRMLLALLITYAAVLLLTRTAGFRRSADLSLPDLTLSSARALALSLLCTTLVLVLLRQVNERTPLDEALGKIIFEAVPFAIGAAVANQFLSSERADGQQQRPVDAPRSDDAPSLHATLADLGAAAIGALFIAFSIAPTEEVPMLASAISYPWLLALMIFSLLVSYAIVFEAGFGDQQKRHQQEGIFQQPLTETIAAYLVSLCVAAFMLWFFNQLRVGDPWQFWLQEIVVSGLPATIGGAAGRLAI